MTTNSAANTVRSADGTPIAWEQTGSGPLVVLVDPAGAYRGFGPLRGLPGVLAQDFTVVTYDRRGRGSSGDTPPYAIEREVEDLAGVISGVGDSAFVFGFSSGASLALHAAVSGVPVTKLAVLEPPIADEERAHDDAAFTAELAELVAAGRNGAAVQLFHESIGMPPEALAAMAPEHRAALDALAPTLVYDCTISAGTPVAVARAVAVPTLVLDSSGTTGDLPEWAAAVSAALPQGTARSLPGEWHGVADEDLAAALREFFLA